MAKQKKAKRKTPKSGAKKNTQNSLVANINRRKKAGTSRAKKDSTISAKAYAEMQKGWPASRKRKKG